MREFYDIPAAVPAAVRRPDGGLAVTTEPVPRLNDGDILFRLLAAGVSRADLGPAGPDSMVLVGETAALGNRVRGWGPGDRAVVRIPLHPARDANWPRAAGYFRLPASVMRARTTFKLPREITVDEAVLLPETARAGRALREARLGDGDTFVVAGLGLLGQVAVALAHHRRRARVVAADVSATLRRRAEFNGAGVLVHLPHQSVFEAVAGRSGGQGASAALVDGVPPAVLQEVLGAMAPGGTLILAGVHEPVWPLDARTLLQRELRIQGVAAGEARDVKDAAKAFQQGLLDPDTLITKRLGWDDLPGQGFGPEVWDHALCLFLAPGD